MSPKARSRSNRGCRSIDQSPPTLRSPLNGRLIPDLETLTLSIHNSSFGQIVRRKFNFHAITGNDSDKVLSHFSSDMSQYQRPFVNLNAKSRICECLRNSALDFQCFFFFRHPRKFSNHLNRQGRQPHHGYSTKRDPTRRKFDAPAKTITFDLATSNVAWQLLGEFAGHRWQSSHLIMRATSRRSSRNLSFQGRSVPICTKLDTLWIFTRLFFTLLLSIGGCRPAAFHFRQMAMHGWASAPQAAPKPPPRQ